MKFALSALTALLGLAAPALAHAEPAAPQTAAPSGVHGFDFEVGN
jgi:hypothetical protein